MTHRLLRPLQRLRALLRRDTLDESAREEMRLHLDLEAQDLARSQGLPPNEAQRRARASFGGVDHYLEAHRDARGLRWLRDSARDARYALRSLRRTPAFTLSAAAVLSLGIGSSTAIFSAVDAVLISRLPYPNEHQLVRIVQQNSPTNRFGVSTVDYRAIESEQRSFSTVGAALGREVAIATTGAPRRAQATAATASFFATLGVTTARGRGIQPGDESLGAPPVVVLSHLFAVREFGAADSAPGKTITIDGTAHTVVGVLPRGVNDLAGARAELWPALRLPTPQRRGPFTLRVVARLKDDVSMASAASDLAGISRRLHSVWAASFADAVATLTPYSLREMMLGNAAKTLWLFVAAVALVLLIAVANVASLVLVRATSRAREAALRTMLGASRARLARLLVTESVILSALGAILGLALAWGLLRALMVLRGSIPRVAEASLDPRALIFAALVTGLTGVLIGLYPVFAILRRSPGSTLAGGDREVGASRSTHMLRGALVTVQFALALPLLAGAGLLLNSFVRLQRVDTGFDASRVLYMRVSLPGSTYSEAPAALTFWARAIARVQQVPNAEHVGVGSCIPPDECWDVNNFDLVDRPVPPGTPQPTSPWSSASPAFFEALGVPLLDGRFFTVADDSTAPPVLIVSRAWVRHHSPDRPAVGRQLRDGGCTTCTPSTIVGVVGDVKYQGLAQSGEAVFRSSNQEFVRDAYLFVRTAGPPRAAIPAVRSALHSLDPALALDDAGLVQDRVAGSTTPQRQWTQLLGGFALAALVLAAVGIFGMLSYLVTSRQREIGVRIALGAGRGEVISLLVGQGMRSALPGAALGLLVAVLARRMIEGSLFAVDAADPLTLGTVTLLLLSVAAVASWLPARRAARTDAMRAIRSD